MLKQTRIATALLLLGLSACGSGKSVVGRYLCPGVPTMQNLELRSNGTFASRGDIMGVVHIGTGGYTVDSGHVTIKGTETREGMPPDSVNMTFDRQENGDLNWILAKCTKQ